MSKKFLRALTVLLAVVAVVMVLSFAACGKQSETTTPTQETTAQTAAPSESSTRALSLTEASLSVTTWSSPNGATVNLTAVPSEHDKDDSAEFVVLLDGVSIASVPCEWKDNAYVASAELNGADGYGYYVTITSKDGSFVELPVNTPEDPTDENLVNLASSLQSYCTLTLNDASLEGDDLTILSGYALVQAPRITENDENVACAQANLVLTLDGQELSSIALTMAPGEADRSYDANITDMSFTVPEDIGEGQQLVLRLDAVLTNGQILTALGGSWTAENGTIANAVG
ncbi:MAG: hypothetical protein Q4F81_00175 [Eubacteriales bacterium]|nr:hypothetical protein [Eubacteriales bacterium]